MTVYHCSLDLDSIVHHGAALQMVGRVRLPGQVAPATTEALVAHAVILKARGYEAMPTCNQHDKLGYCVGHQGR